MVAGRLRRDLAPARDALLGALAWMEASIDFPDDEVPTAALVRRPGAAEAALDGVLARADAAPSTVTKYYRRAGRRPNVGKSSLMNALLRYERAIVYACRRDDTRHLAESLSVRGIPVIVTDTPGYQSNDIVERIGVSRSRQALSSSPI